MNSLFSTIIDIVWFIDHRYDRFFFNINSGNISGLLFGNMYCISSLPCVIHRNEAFAFAYRSNCYYCCYYYPLYFLILITIFIFINCILISIIIIHIYI